MIVINKIPQITDKGFHLVYIYKMKPFIFTWMLKINYSQILKYLSWCIT